MKTKKRFLSILLSFVMVLGLLPGMIMTANADGQYTIYNEIPSSLATVTCDPSANEGVNVSLTVNTSGKKTVGGQKRNIKLDGITVSKVNGEIVTVNWTTSSQTEYTGSFTMPGEAVYISFPFLNDDVTVFDISQNTAVFRTKKISVTDTYTFETTDAEADIQNKDPYGYLYYKASAGDNDYTGTSNDDGGVGYNFKIDQLLPANTYCHIGVGHYNSTKKGEIELYSGLLPSVTPEEINLEYDDTSASRILTVTPNMPDGYTATYQWYESNSQSTSYGSEIPGATNSTYSIPQDLVAGSTKYYYCKVQATKGGVNLRSFSSIATVTITKSKAVPATVTANNRNYDGTEKPLVTVDNSTLVGGTMKYALGTDDITKPTEGWSDTIPTGKDDGTYYVWYKVKGDQNHYDSEPRCVTVNIANVLYTVTSVENWEHTIDYPNDTIITVKRNTADNITYSMYTGASVDGNGIPANGSSVAQGSLILTLKGSYLDTLSTGTHKVTISFKDGSADATISIVNAPPAPTAAPTHVPKTGDGANLVLWIGLILLGFLGIIAFAGMAGRKHRNR